VCRALAVDSKTAMAAQKQPSMADSTTLRTRRQLAQCAMPLLVAQGLDGIEIRRWDHSES
jgi:hypothetical protein